jgi:hypothetical protein
MQHVLKESPVRGQRQRKRQSFTERKRLIIMGIKA